MSEPQSPTPTQPVTPTLATTTPAATTHTPLQAVSQPLSGSSLLTQVGSMLGGVLILILAIAWLVRKLGITPPIKQNKLLKVVSSCQVGQRERIVVVEIDKTWLVVGVTPQQITHLHTLPAKESHELPAAEANVPADFRQLLTKVLKRPEKP